MEEKDYKELSKEIEYYVNKGNFPRFLYDKIGIIIKGYEKRIEELQTYKIHSKRLNPLMGQNRMYRSYFPKRQTIKRPN